MRLLDAAHCWRQLSRSLLEGLLRNFRVGDIRHVRGGLPSRLLRGVFPAYGGLGSGRLGRLWKTAFGVHVVEKWIRWVGAESSLAIGFLRARGGRS